MVDKVYRNPLNNYRSHSIHYVLIAASTTEDLRQFADGGESLSSISSTGISDLIPGSNAYLIFDTRRFSQFNVGRLSWETVYGTGVGLNPHVATSSIDMRLNEANGITFANTLADIIANKMQVDLSSLFFMLKVMFVGHTDTDTTEFISNTNICCFMYDISMTFNEQGAVYDINFFQIEPGILKNQYIDMNIIRHVSTENSTTGRNTLAALLGALESRLNKESLNVYQKNRQKAVQMAGTAVAAKETEPTGKLVQYMINIPPEWEGDSFTIASAVSSGRLETIFKKTADEAIANEQNRRSAEEQRVYDTSISNGLTAEQANAEVKKLTATYKTFSWTTTIPEAITTILKSCPSVLALGGNKSREQGDVQSFKITTNITSDEFTYVIHYDVYPYHAPDINRAGDNKILSGSGAEKVIRQTADGYEILNGMVLDYIFSGKNSEVMDFQIAIKQLNTMFFNNVGVGETYNEKKSVLGQGESEVTGEVTNVEIQRLWNKSPVFFPVQSQEQKRAYADNPNPGEGTALVNKQKQEFTSTMAFLHFITGNSSPSTKIKGNPNLIGKFGNETIAKHYTIVNGAANLIRLAEINLDQANEELRTSVANAKRLYRDEYYLQRINKTPGSTGDILIDGGHPATAPLFVKINIKSPRSNYLGRSDFGDFTDEFFYKGWWFVLGAVHTIEGSTFSHDLTMNAFQPTAEITNITGVGNAN